MTQIADVSLATTIFSGAVGAGVNGTAFASPAQACLISWQVNYGTPPGSITVNFQVSNDGTNWSTIDTTTSTVSGTVRITAVTTKFYRINISAVAGGDTMTVIVVPGALNSGAGIFDGNTIVATQAIATGTGADITEDTLFSVQLNARSFVQTGRSIRVRAWGHTGANGNTKTIRVKFGGDNWVALSGAVNNVDWSIDFIVMRRAFSSFTRKGNMLANGILPVTSVFTASVDETSPILLSITGQTSVATANDVTCEGVIVDSIPGIAGIV